MGKAIRLPNGEVFRPDPEFPMDEELVYLSEPASDPEVGTYYSGPISDVDDVCPEDRPSKAVTVSSGQSIPGFGKPLATPDMQKSIRRLVQDLADAKQVCMGLRQVAHALKVASADFIILAADTDPASILTPVTELCIERELPFVWVSSRKALGAWCGVKASSSCVAVLKDVATHLKGQVAEVREQIAVLWRYSEPEE